MLEQLKAIFLTPKPYIVIIAIGVLLKFYGIESKFKWLDEVFTMSHTSGLGMTDFEETIPGDTTFQIADFNAQLDMNNGQYTLGKQLHGLSKMVQVTPLHYFMLVFWHRVAGGDLVDYRLFSVLMCLLSIPLLYELTRELTRSRVTGLVAASLFSVAPFFHYYAQEARYYSLWGFAIILVNLVLLKALKLKGHKWWLLYGVAAVFATYVSTMSILVLVGHLVFIMIYHRDVIRQFALTGAGVFMCYLPWIIAMFGARGEIANSTSWQQAENPIWKVFLGPVYGMATTFFTTPSDTAVWAAFTKPDDHSLLAIAIQTAIIALIVTAIIYGVRHVPKRVRTFNLLGVIGFLLMFWSFDLYTGRILSFVYRYHIPIMISTVIIVAVYLGQHIEQGKLAFTGLFLVLTGLSIYSSIRISSDPCYFNMGNCDNQLEAAAVVSVNKNPLIVTSSDHWALTYIFWEFAQEIESDDVSILRDPDPVHLEAHLTGHNHSEVYLYNINPKAKYTLLELLKSRRINQPLPYTITEFSTNFFDSEEMHIDIPLDTTLDLTLRNITIELRTPAVPLEDTLFIVGGHYTLGLWDPNAVPMHRVADDLWSVTLEIEKSLNEIKYTFTKGDWPSQPFYEDGNAFEGFTHELTNDTTFQVELPFWEHN